MPRGRWTDDGQVRRKNLKELLSHLIPLMLDCLKSPEWVSLPGGTSAGGGSRNSLPADGPRTDGLPGEATHLNENASTSSPVADVDGGMSEGAPESKKGVREVVVLHYYEEHQYVLKATVLDTMNR